MDDIVGQFGKRVREVRERVGETQERLALLAGLDRSYMGAVERGRRNVTLKTVSQIATALGVSVTELFAEEPKRKAKSENEPKPTARRKVTKSRGVAPTVGCLFAAMGGFVSGFESAGARAIWANEYDKFACQTLHHNYPHVEVHHADIHRLRASKLTPPDILTAGFPCQTFSQAGEREGFSDRRGLLFFEITRLLKEWGDDRPSFVVLENVKHLLGHEGGRTFRVIASRLAGAGYLFGLTSYKVMDAQVYTGIPQHRERVFMVAASTARFREYPFRFPSRPRRLKKIPLRQLLDTHQKADDRYYIGEDDTYHGHFKRAIGRGAKDSVYTLRRGNVRENRSGACPTLTANMGTGGHNQPVVKDRWGIRKLTPDECLRLQGYPASFTFPPSLSDTQRYKQLGNTVCVPLVTMIAEGVVECLSGA